MDSRVPDALRHSLCRYAEPGPYQTPAPRTAPALQRTASQELRAALRPGHELHHHRRIGQLVAAAAVLREMFCEMPRHRRDPLEHTGFVLAVAELGFHYRADCAPFGGPDLGMDAAVGEDLHVAVR